MEGNVRIIECGRYRDLVKALYVRDAMMSRAGWKSRTFEYPRSPYVIGSFYELDRSDDRSTVKLSFGQKDVLTVTQAQDDTHAAVTFNLENLAGIRPEDITDADSLVAAVTGACLSEDNISRLRVATLDGCEVVNVIEDSRCEDSIPICFVDSSRRDVIMALCDKFGSFTTQSPAKYEDTRLKLTQYFPKFTSRATVAPFSAYSLLFDGKTVRKFDWNRALSQSRPKQKSLADSADRVAGLCSALARETGRWGCLWMN